MGSAVMALEIARIEGSISMRSQPSCVVGSLKTAFRGFNRPVAAVTPVQLALTEWWPKQMTAIANGGQHRPEAR